MTNEAVLTPRPPVVLTKPRTPAKSSKTKPIFHAAVAARATDRGEPVATRRTVEQHGKKAAGAVAGIAIASQHDAAVDVVEIVFPGLAIAERNVGRIPEISVT